LDAAAMSADYQETYYGETNRRFHPWFEWLVGLFRRRRANKLASLVQPGRLLDIGCGRGLEAADLARRGWRVKCCELSETSSRYARDVLRLDVDCDGFHGERFADGAFDAIILWHVLEHFADPRDVLTQCARLLRPGGVLALAVPNFDSWQAGASHYAWFHLDLPRHYSHFSASWLREQLAALGFRITHEYQGSLEQNPFGWIQSVLNRVGLRHNLLYDLIRRESARTTKRPWREAPAQSLVSAAGLVVLLPFAFAMWLPEVLLKRGATVEIHAVRESSRGPDACGRREPADAGVETAS
jgi:2-polyprenyl-3-methyl-5-hydroxy-6-metoxy-1,4-benzoquinol methylase